MNQRMAMALALLLGQRVLLADEPPVPWTPFCGSRWPGS